MGPPLCLMRNFCYMDTCWAPGFEMGPKLFTVATVPLPGRPMALWLCVTEQVTVALHSIFVVVVVVEDPPKWCTCTTAVWLLMAGATWNCCCLAACSVYTMHQFAVSLYLRPRTKGACHHVRLAVTCHLRLWQNGLHLLQATAVAWGWNWYQNENLHRKLKNLLRLLLPGMEPTTLQSWVRCLATELFPLPWNIICENLISEAVWKIGSWEPAMLGDLRWKCNRGHWFIQTFCDVRMASGLGLCVYNTM